MRKNRIQSAFYIKSPLLMSTEDRLDYMYWHPKFENAIKTLSASKFPVEELSSVVKSPIISGKTPDNYVFPLKGIPFLGARNIKDGRIDLTDITYIDDYIHNGELASSKISEGDVLVTIAGAIGRCAVYIEGKEVNISQAIARVQPDFERINPQYLAYYLNSNIGQTQLDRNRHDVNQPNINTTEMGKILVVRPPVKLQDEIVKQLSDIKNAIDYEQKTQEAVLHELRNVVMTELGLSVPLVECDYYNQLYERSEDRLDFVWNHPTTLSVKHYLELQNAISLGDLIQDEVAYGINASGKEKGKIAFINIEQVNPDGTIHKDGLKYLEEAPPDKLLEPNDILVCRSRAVGTSAIVTETERRFAFGSFILRIRLRKDANVSPAYVVSFMNSDLGRIQFKFLQTGAEKFAFTQKTGRGGGNNINTTQLKRLMIILPKTPTVQLAILERTKQLLKNKQKVDAQLETLTTTYRGAFERLLFGIQNKNTSFSCHP